MLLPELKKLKFQLENGENITVDKEKLLKELQELENVKAVIQHSLSLSGKLCPTCGRRI